MLCLNLQSSDQHPSRYRCYIITFVIIEAVMAAQSSFEFTSVFREEAVVKGIFLKAPMVMVAVRGGCGWVVGGGCDVIFNITEGG